MAPVPLLIVCDFNGLGGTQTQILELLAAVDRARVAPRVAALTVEPRLGRRLEELEVDVTNLRLTAALSLRTWRAISSLAEKVARERIALLHGFLFQGNAVAAVAAGRADVRYLTSVRNLELWKRPHEVAISRWCHAGASMVTFNSRHVRDLVCAREGVPASRTRVIANGVRWEPGPPDSGEAPWPEGAGPKLVCVASLTRKKGHRHLLEAFARVAGAMPAAALALVGEGPERDGLEATAARLGISERVRFAGSRPDARAIIAAADLLVLASIEEGMPNVIIEAMAAGVPQVATSAGGTPETMEDGGTGFVVPPGDPVLMSERIFKILRDPGLRSELAARGRRLHAERFGVERMARAHETLYEEVLGRDSVAGSEFHAEAVAR